MTSSRLSVMEKRVHVSWGDYSQVEATLSMYRAVMGCGRDYERVILLSGLDYPAASNEDIYESLLPEREWIAGCPLEGDSLDFKCRTYHFMALPKLPRVALRELGRVFHVKKAGAVPLDGRDAKVWFAPQWTALSPGCIEHILEVCDRNPLMCQYFKTAYAPDELMIPTIVFNSEYGSLAEVIDTSHGPVHYNEFPPLHYLNYEPVIEVFDETAYEAIVESGKLFFRKARSGASDALLALIDDRRQQGAL